MDALKYVSQILDDADSWETMMFLYDAALRQMSTKIDILNEEFIHIHNYNPIEHVKSRIKEPKSIVKKLKRHGHEVTLENMLKYITDIAGIRIICSFTQDIYRIADMLAKQSDLRVVELTDYITHPKVSGYRSYHMLVACPGTSVRPCGGYHRRSTDSNHRPGLLAAWSIRFTTSSRAAHRNISAKISVPAQNL